MAIGTFVGIGNAISRKKSQKKLRKELANAPKYKITDEAFENQALAKSNLYGRDRAIQMGQENISQSAADASQQARDITSSTSGLMSAIAQINADKNLQLRGLAGEDASQRQGKLGLLMNANNAMIDEKDKAWNYNENMPFQMRVAALRDKIKTNQELEMAGLAYEGQTVSAFASMMGGMMGACDRELKEDILPIQENCTQMVMSLQPVRFNYKEGRYNDGRRHIGFIAQDVATVVPEAVREIDLGTEQHLIVDFKELVPVLVKVIQEQQRDIKELKKTVVELCKINLAETE